MEVRNTRDGLREDRRRVREERCRCEGGRMDV